MMDCRVVRLLQRRLRALLAVAARVHVVGKLAGGSTLGTAVPEGVCRSTPLMARFRGMPLIRLAAQSCRR